MLPHSFFRPRMEEGEDRGATGTGQGQRAGGQRACGRAGRRQKIDKGEDREARLRALLSLTLLLFSFAVLTRGHLLPSLVPSVPPSSHFDAIAVRPHRQSSPDWRRRRSSSRDLRAASANERENEGERDGGGQAEGAEARAAGRCHRRHGRRAGDLAAVQERKSGVPRPIRTILVMRKDGFQDTMTNGRVTRVWRTEYTFLLGRIYGM